MTTFDRAWGLVKKPMYYHATPEKNMGPIMHEGIKGRGDEVYASRNAEIARNWIMLTNPGAEKILTLPFFREEGDERMRPGQDHHPSILSTLGFDPEKDADDAAWTHQGTVPPNDIRWEEARVHSNPLFNEAFASILMGGRRGEDE